MKNKLCLDIGGTALKYAILTSELNEIKHGVITYNKVAEADEVFVIINELVSKLEKEVDFEKICISTAGSVDTKTTKMLGQSSIIGLENKDFRKDIFSKKPIYAENDAFCAGIAQIKMNNINNAFVYIAGTGIAGCIIIDGKIYKGSNALAGSFGLWNVSLGINELAHSKGSASFLRMRYKELSGKDKNGKEILESINSDKNALQASEELADNLWTIICNACFVLDPNEIYLGGGIFENEWLFQKVKAKYEDLISKLPFDFSIQIKRCAKGSKTNLYGAYFLDEIY